MKRLNAMPQTALVFMFLGFWLAFQLIFQSQPFSDPAPFGTFAWAIGYSNIGHSRTPTLLRGATPADFGFPNNGGPNARCRSSIILVALIRCSR